MLRATLLTLIASASLSGAALAASQPPPPEPPTHPDWAAINASAIQLLKGTLIDPGSAVVTWTSGFQWGYVKNVMKPKQFGWIACGTYNAKNRLGGYVGAAPFLIIVAPDGSVSFQNDAGDAAGVFLNAVSYKSTCQDGRFVPINPELRNVDPSAPPAPAVAAPVDPADEIQKLAVLRDKGIITQVEFDAQKAKLLAH